jgi:hypothetical protein
MGFLKVTKEELAQMRIIDAFKLHDECFFTIIEAPSKRDYSFDVDNKDRRYLMGIIFTYPIDVQKSMWEYIIKNFILHKERKRWIKNVQDWLQQIALDDNILEHEPTN